jgi:putative oxidoreductase
MSKRRALYRARHPGFIHAGETLKPQENPMFRRFLETDRSTTLTFQRAVLALVVSAHGAQKLLGWFGGYGVEGTVGWFAQALHVPAPIALLVVLSDSLGAVALAAGLFTRFVALGTAATMAGAILLLHASNGFFMNWGGTLAGEGYEFHLLALALALPLVVRGGGAWSIDTLLARRLARSAPALTPAAARA